ncbi:MAG: hypothetical protein KAT00_02855 [Planctomycetes bacterium]|nr:hypothetical protein [Planctomycetota bacterium]
MKDLVMKLKYDGVKPDVLDYIQPSDCGHVKFLSQDGDMSRYIGYRHGDMGPCNDNEIYVLVQNVVEIGDINE